MLAERPALVVVAWLITYAIHSTVLIGGAWLAACLLAKAACSSARLRDRMPSLRDRLWKVALVGGVLTASLQTGLGFEPWGARFALAPSAVLTSSAGESRHAIAVQPATLTGPAAAPHPLDARLVDDAYPARGLDAQRTLQVHSGPAASLESSPTSSRWALILLVVWGAGVAFGLARWLCQWNRLMRRLDDRQPVRSGELFEVYQHLRLRSKARSHPTLCAAPGISAPITLGLAVQEICVPPRVVSELQRDEIAALLAHELAHAERRDPLWVAIGRLIEITFFFQPLNRLCSTWLQDEAEYLADDWAVVQIGERVPLASCLTEIAGWIVHEPHMALASGMAARGSRLALRVRRLLDEEREPMAGVRAGWITALGAAGVALVGLLVPGVAAHASAPSDDLALERRTRDLERALDERSGGAEQLGKNALGTTTPASDPVVAEGSLASHAAQEPAVAAAPDAPGAASTASPCPTALANIAADRAAESSSGADLGDVLGDLERELDEMRDALREREPAPELAARIDGLQSRVEDLRAKHTLLRALLDVQLPDGAAFTPVFTTTLPDSFHFTKD